MKKFLSLALCATLLLALIPMLTQTVSAESLSKFNIRLDEPIASYSPDFSPEFNTNAQVYNSVTWQENSPGFSAKLNSSDEFKAGLAYKVEIWIRLGDGNYFPVDGYGDLATAITVNGKAISSLKIKDRNEENQITEVTITCEYDPLPGREISSVLITGVPTPVAGNMPIYSFTLGSTSYGFYHTEPVVWTDKTNNSKQLDNSDKFIQGHVYQLSIWLYANREGGFTFKTDQNGNPQVSATINSWAADKVIKAYEQDGREVIELLYTFPACQAAHTCVPKLVPQQAPTCLMYGFKAYYECSCGKCFEDAAGKKEITDMDGYGIIAALGHNEGSWSYNGTHHYRKCTRCLEVIPGTNAAHSGGKATCVEKGKCTVCGYAYLPENEDHTPESKWTACGALYHAHLCKLCGAHCDPLDHTPGPEATDITPQTCTVCGYIISPAKNHKHDLSRVPQTPADCTHGGNIEYYFCVGCNDCFTDAEGKNKIPETMSVQLGALGHTASESWSYDEQYHWRSCDVCKVVLDETKMHHEFAEGVCTTCGYKEGAQIEPSEETEPTQPTEPAKETSPNDDPKGTNWMLIILVGLISFGAATTVAVICLKKKK